MSAPAPLSQRLIEKLEYKVSEPTSDTLEYWLNESDKDGWKVISFSHNEYGNKLILGRSKTNNVESMGVVGEAQRI